MKPTILTTEYNSPAGSLLLGSVGHRLAVCYWLRDGIEQSLSRYYVQICECSATTKEAARQLDEYFAGTRCEFTLPLLCDGTPFQKEVWEALSHVTYGRTLSYKDLAALAGRPTAVRAVANAVGANPLSIFIPCHRIIGSDGSLTGYAGGLQAKQALLRLEAKTMRLRTEACPSDLPPW